MQAREAIWVAVYLDDMAFFVFSLEPILNCAGEYPLTYIVSLWPVLPALYEQPFRLHQLIPSFLNKFSICWSLRIAEVMGSNPVQA